MFSKAVISSLVITGLCVLLTSCSSTPSTNRRVQDKLNEATSHVNHGMIYFNNDQFIETRQSLISSQLCLSDISTLLENQKISTADKNNITQAVTAMNEVLLSITRLTEIMETLKTRDDWLTWRPYNTILDKLAEAKSRLISAEQTAAHITDAKFKTGLEKIGQTAAKVEAALEMFKQNKVENAVKIYTYFYKIDIEAVRDQAIKITKDRLNDKDRVTAVFNFVRDNISYVKDPRYNQMDWDYIQTPRQTLERGAGDCDDYSILLSSLLEAIGFKTKLCFIDTENKEPPIFNHMNVKINIDTIEYVLEATCKTCKIGDYPAGKTYSECYDYAKTKESIQNLTLQIRKIK